MNRGLYIAAAGMKAALARQDIRANNLANAATTGFKRDMEIVSSFMPVALEQNECLPVLNPGAALQIPVFTHTVTDMQRGSFQETGNDLDITVNGNGFLEVGTGQDRAYVQTASFRVIDGTLVTDSGKPVIGQDGNPISPDSEKVTIGPKGEVYTNGTQIANLSVVQGDPGTAWIKKGSGEFVSVGVPPVRIQNPDVLTGIREASNVNGITEMVGMISLYRGYEAGQKAMQTIDQTLERSVNEVGSVR